jgi:hypothetical protein
VGPAIVIAAGGLVIGAGMPAVAVPAGTIATFPTWTTGGSPGAFDATADFASPTLADATITSTSATMTVASGASSYLGAGTSFAAEYGTARAEPYLTLRPASASPAPTPPAIGTPPESVTTITFPSAPAPGWGFALGDIDADWAFLVPRDGSSAPLAPALLGEQGTGNYCQASPKPSSCAGTPGTDVPNWTATGTTVDYGTPGAPDPITWAAGTVYGNVTDTTGAYIWFMPDPSVRSVEIHYGALSGSPVFQLWLVAPAPATTITGTVQLDTPGAVPAGTSVELESADGTPVADLDGDPVAVPVDPSGAFTITTEQRDQYRLVVDPPAGFTAPPATIVAANTAVVTADPITIAAAPPGTTPGTPPAPELAATGIDARTTALIGGLLAASGALVVGIARRRRRG